jgi:autotransporter-associated beta strand protein
LTLTAANTSTGLTTVNSGTLSIGNGGTTGSVAGGIANNAAVQFNRSNAATYDGAISGSGTVTKLGSGTLTLTGTSGYTGATTVSAGSLFLQGRLGNTAVTVENGATFGGSGVSTGSVTVSSGGIFAPGGVAPGSIEGVLTVGSLTLNGGSNTNLDIAGSSVAGTDYDQVVVSGGMTYGGNLNLAFTNGSEFAVGTTLNLFNLGGSIGGDLASVNATGGAYGGLTFTNDGSGVWWSTDTASKQFLKFTQATGNLVVVPEPSTWAMGVMGLAMAGLSEFRRRRAGRKAPTTC